jgi:serine protease Do
VTPPLVRPGRVPHRLGIIVLGFALAALLLAAGPSWAAPAWNDFDGAASHAYVGNDVPKNVEELLAIEKKFREAATKAVKSVVGIQIGMSRGSGVIVSADGLILTAGHVVGKPGQEAIIVLSDGRKLKGKTLGVYASADAGMMKIIDKGSWPFVELAPKGRTAAGDWCLAIGHPLGFQEGRPPVVRMGRVLRLEERAVQTDCSLIVGDSGGPLVNLDGKLIGINSRISGALNMNFHVPIDVFHDNWERLKKGDAWADNMPSRDATQVKSAFHGVIADAAKCVVRIRCGSQDVVLGTVVGPDGWILTKASELKGRVVVRLADGRDLEARTVGISPQFDLAMLKIDAVDLPGISWGLADPGVGQWVASPGTDGEPLAVGVVSLPRRPIPGTKGSLGVLIGDTEKGVAIVGVMPNSPAAKIGLEKNDLITHVDGRPVKNKEELTARMVHHGPGATVKLTVRRGETTLEKSVTLGRLVTPGTRQRDMLNATGVGVSGRHDDFPVVLQHDGVVKPTDCGGPVVTLDGKVVGVNIARGGRTETYCVPANALIGLMYELMSGRLHPAAPVASAEPADQKPTAEPKKEERGKPAEPEKKETPKTEQPKPEPPKGNEKAPEAKPAPKAEPAPKKEPEMKPAPPEQQPKPEPDKGVEKPADEKKLVERPPKQEPPKKDGPKTEELKKQEQPEKKNNAKGDAAKSDKKKDAEKGGDEGPRASSSLEQPDGRQTEDQSPQPTPVGEPTRI